MRIREEEKRNSVKRKKSTSSNTTISSTITSTSISSTTSDQRPNQRPKRPESVAQRVIRERKEKKISTKVPQTSASQRPKTSSAKAKRQPLHVALRQSASKHGSRALRTEKIKQQTHFNAVKDFQVFFKCSWNPRINPIIYSRFSRFITYFLSEKKIRIFELLTRLLYEFTIHEFLINQNN